MNLALVRLISRRFSSSVRSKGFFSFSKAVAFFSVMLGSMALIISLAVLSGFEESLHGIAARFSSHIQVHPHRSMFVSDPMDFARRLRNLQPEIVSAVPVIQFDGLIYRKGCTEGVVIKSNDQRSDGPAFGARRILVGTELSDDTTADKRLLVGKKLARKLACTAGDTVFLTVAQNGVQDLSSVVTIPFQVAGIYETGMAQYDDVYVYAPYAVLSSLPGALRSNSSYVELWLRHPEQAPTVARAIEVYCDYRCETVTIDDLHRGMFAWIDLQKRPVPIVLGLISIVAVFNILTTLLISIVEKSGSYAILLTLGMRTSTLLSSVAWQGLVIGFLGTCAGCGIALLFCVLQQHYGFVRLDGEIYFLNALPVTISAVHYGIVIGVSLTLCLLATLVPGFIATRISPVSAMRFK